MFVSRVFLCPLGDGDRGWGFACNSVSGERCAMVLLGVCGMESVFSGFYVECDESGFLEFYPFWLGRFACWLVTSFAVTLR